MCTLAGKEEVEQPPELWRAKKDALFAVRMVRVTTREDYLVV